MYPVSEAYLSAIRAKTRTDRLTGTIVLTDETEVLIDETNIESGSVELERSCVTGEELTFGEVILAELRIGIITDLNRYLFFGGKLSLNYELQLSDGTWETVPVGVYTIGEAERDKNIVSIIAYDNLITLDEDFGGAVYYGTPYEIAIAICELLGMTLANTEEEILEFPNGDQIIQIDETSGAETYRDAVKVLCQMLGAFAVADRTGQLLFRRYDKEPIMTITSAERFTPTISDFVVSYIGLIVKGSKAEFAVYDEEAENGLEMTINDAPAWDYGLEETLQERTQNLFDELKQIQYTPCELPMPGDPAFDCGDMVALPVDDTTTANSLITKITWRFRGRMDMNSTGKNPLLYGLSPKKSKVIRELQAKTTANKLTFYSFTNQSEVVASSGGSEQQVSQVTFVTTEATSAMFIAQLPVVVACEDTVASDTKTNTTTTEYAVVAKDEDGSVSEAVDAEGNPLTLTVSVTQTDTDTVKTVTHGYVDLQVEYYLQGSLVDYELIQRCYAGRHLLALFYAFDSLDGDDNYQWQVKIRVAGGTGTVTVPKRAFRATVTGQGMAGTEEWDGTLSFDESVSALSLRSATTVVPVSEEVSESRQVPMAIGTVEETVAAFSIRSMLSLGTVGEVINVNPTWERQTITAAMLDRWDYNSRYVWVTDSGVQLRTAWEYQSARQEIDEGRMTVVKAVTSDLVTVESLEVGTA